MKVLIGNNPMGLENAIPDLQNRYPHIRFVHAADRAQLAGQIVDADVYVGWLNRDLFMAARQLKWIQSPSSGINAFLEIPELVQSDVLLTSARGTHGACVAESAIGMILAFTRQIRGAILAQQQRRWAMGELRPRTFELTGSILGVIGMGTIGQAIAKRAVAFDMRVIAVDMLPTNCPPAEVWGMDRLDDLLRQADFVAVTVPYTPATAGLIGARQIALLKPTAMLIGISRGGIIDETALITALREGRLAAAALDVFAQEPLPADSPLWELDNLLITPHIAGGSQFEGRYILEIFYENLERFLNGNLPLRNQIDKRRGF